MPLNINDLKVSVGEISAGHRIADKFAADHGNNVPSVSITGVPEGTAEMALILHDPDAPLPHGFTHWVVYGIEPQEGRIGGEILHGPNGIGQNAYSGPQPPPGHGTHHYYFWAYALDCKVEGTPNREEFLSDYAGNILEQARLVATYDA